MSLFRRVLGLEADPATAAAPAAPARPTPAVAVGDTESVRRIAARLDALPPERARFVAAFAYLLARAAEVDLAPSDAEAVEMTRQIVEVGQLDHETAALVVALAETRVEGFGATEDYLVTREFKAISTYEDRERLLRCCLLVAAADDSINADESWLVNRMAEELDVERVDLNRIRDEFHDRLAGIQELRRMRTGLAQA
jgi:uncharacterized tellurite resistance protein B-like protein